MSITTKTGDHGTTALLDGTRVSKADPRIICMGELDELTAQVGLCKALLHQDMPFSGIQHLLMSIMSYVSSVGCEPTERTQEEWVTLRSSLLFAEEWMEKQIDAATKNKPFSFLLPGNSLPDAALHMARTKARTCERLLVDLPTALRRVAAPGAERLSEKLLPEEILRYMNRLSDFFYSLSLDNS